MTIGFIIIIISINSNIRNKCFCYWKYVNDEEKKCSLKVLYIYLSWSDDVNELKMFCFPTWDFLIYSISDF